MMSVDFRDVRYAADISHVLRALGWPVTWSMGAQHRGPCPIHRSTHRCSHVLHVTGESWYCHVCKRGGDVIDLVAAVEGWPLARAAVRACELGGVALAHLDSRRRSRDHWRRHREEAR